MHTAKPRRSRPLKWLRRTFWQTMRRLPEPLRIALIRRMFPVTAAPAGGIEFKLAQTRDEFEQAFGILYTEFKSSGYMDANDARLRLTKYHALADTAVIIGKLGGEVVCTLSVINDSPMGLPMDATWDLSAQRLRSKRVAEISSLAIRRDVQGQRGAILLPLCKFMYEYCAKYAGIDCIVISTLDSVRDFYKAILLFEPVGDGAPKPYGFVKGVLAYAQVLDIAKAPARYRQAYAHRPDRFNLYKFFVETSLRQFSFPAPRRGQRVDPLMSAATLDYFFNQKLPILKTLADAELRHLRGMYRGPDYLGVIPEASLRN